METLVFPRLSTHSTRILRRGERFVIRERIQYSEKKKKKKNEFDEYILVGFNNEGNNRRTPRRLLLLDRYFFNWHQRNGAKLVKVGRSLDTLPFYLARHPN